MSQRSTKSATLLAREVSPFHREPFVTTGYRDSDNITIRQCLATLFTIHNETFNIWSCLLPCIGFIVYSASRILGHDVIGNPAVYPILCYSLATCFMFLSSSFAHLFCCMSWRARHTCFYIDYTAISVYSFSSSQAYIFYCRPLSDDSFVLHRYPYIFLGISFCLSCINIFFNCMSRHRYQKYRFLIRTGMCAVNFVFTLSPFVARCFVSGSTCNVSTVHHFNRFILCFAISGIVNASRLPERLFAGYCDLFGQSHHIFHVLFAIGNFESFNVMFTDMIERKDILSASPYQPTFFTTFGLLILLISVNCVIVVWFVRNWLTAEEEELFSGSKYLVIDKKTNHQVNKKRQ